MTQYFSKEPCDDAVSRQAVLDGLKGCICEDWVKTLFATMVKQLPSVTQKSGKWIKMFLTDTGDIDGQCSECGFIHKFIDGHTAQYNYCHNCGAKMESEVGNGWNV